MHIAIAILLFVTSVVTLAYWADFFLHGSVNVVEAEWSIRFQRAFPAADAFMSVCAGVAGVGLLADAAYGVALALVTGGALIFLGLMDVTFNVQNGLYAHLRSSWPMRAELVINLWSLGLGAALLVTMLPEV
jgi:hypothetical protein